jgi:hypothetical protein
MSTGANDLTAQAAAYDMALRQSEIDNALAQDAYAVQAPFRGLDMASSILGSFAPYATQNMNGTSNSTTTQTQSGGLFGQILQGALGIGSMVAGFPGLGTALGIGSQVAASPIISGGWLANQPNPFAGG